jgi:uncharacterized membrane protein YedE/YeeE
MSDPAKVLNFLDLFGTWDPSLAFVRGGAVLVTFISLTLARRAPLLGGRFELPTRKDLDPRLVAGAVLFGLGWGLGGHCPGPALTALPLAAPGTLAFVPAHAGGHVARGDAGLLSGFTLLAMGVLRPGAECSA